MANNNGTSGAMVMFHIFMTIITGGFWLLILLAWIIIKACSGK